LLRSSEKIFFVLKISSRACKQPRASGRATKRQHTESVGVVSFAGVLRRREPLSLLKKITRRPDPFAPFAVTTDGGMFSTETSTSGLA
jgi:hypothetical protein